MQLSPETFERGLKNYDPALSLRWGPRVKQWVIERKGRRILPSHFRLLKFAASQDKPEPKALEEYESAKAGKYVITYASSLDNRIHDWLWQNDTRRISPDEFAKREVAKQFLPKLEREANLRELDREAISVMGWMNRKHSSEINHGKADALVCEAMKKDAPTGTRQHFDNKPKSVTLFDEFNRPIR
jgi:hypothetical protein